MTKFEDCKKKWLEESDKDKRTIELVKKLHINQRKFGNSFKFPSSWGEFQHVHVVVNLNGSKKPKQKNSTMTII